MEINVNRVRRLLVVHTVESGVASTELALAPFLVFFWAAILAKEERARVVGLRDGPTSPPPFRRDMVWTGRRFIRHCGISVFRLRGIWPIACFR